MIFFFTLIIGISSIPFFYFYDQKTPCRKINKRKINFHRYLKINRREIFFSSLCKTKYAQKVMRRYNGTIVLLHCFTVMLQTLT